MARKQSFDRARTPLSDLAQDYRSPAVNMLSGKDGAVVRDEISRFAVNMLAAREGYEQKDLVDKSINALLMRRPNIFEDANVPDEDRGAFAMALALAYKQSLN